MRKIRWLLLPLAVAAAVGLGFAATSSPSPSHAPLIHYHATGPAEPVTLTALRAGPAVLNGGLYYFQNVQTGLWLHAHAANQIMTDTSGTPQKWLIQDPQVLSNGITYVEIRLYGTNLCANTITNTGTEWASSCQPGASDFNELNAVPARTSSEDWFIPADYCYGCSYWTDDGTSDHDIFDYAPSHGNYAVWGQQLLNVKASMRLAA